MKREGENPILFSISLILLSMAPILLSRGRQTSRRSVLCLALISLLAAQTACGLEFGSSTLPARLSDEEFWNLGTELSEPAGTFTHSDNLVSNEIHYVHTIRRLRPRGGVYIGVGPEQNFSYVARLQPA